MTYKFPMLISRFPIDETGSIFSDVHWACRASINDRAADGARGTIWKSAHLDFGKKSGGPFTRVNSSRTHSQI